MSWCLVTHDSIIAYRLLSCYVYQQYALVNGEWGGRNEALSWRMCRFDAIYQHGMDPLVFEDSFSNLSGCLSFDFGSGHGLLLGS